MDGNGNGRCRWGYMLTGVRKSLAWGGNALGGGGGGRVRVLETVGEYEER